MKVVILTLSLMVVVLLAQSSLSSASPVDPSADVSDLGDGGDVDELTWKDKLSFAYEMVKEWCQDASWYVRDHVIDAVAIVYPKALQYKTYDD